jgi:hypothetical protein|tara:strand:+ start:3005 stop:3634 length:630 start_codon:yes stop_codon:yes gene_type:complete
VTNYNTILDRAKALLEAIENNTTTMWEGSLEESHLVVKFSDGKVNNTHENAVTLDIEQYDGIYKSIKALKESIKETEKAIYEEDARNHPVWRETQINPYRNRSNSPFEFIDGDYDLDAGHENWKVWWESEEIFLYVRIGWTHDDGRDWSDVEVYNWKSEEDTIEWLRDREVDKEDELSDEFILDEAHGLQEIVCFNDGYLINEEKVKVV